MHFLNKRRKDKKAKERFNLRRYFSILSIALITVLTIVLSYIVFMVQKNDLMNYSILETRTFAHNLYDSIYQDIIASELDEHGYLAIVKDSKAYENLNKHAGHYLDQYPGIIKFKIFNMDGQIIFSTDPDDIGVISTSESLKKGLTGSVTHKLTRLGEKFSAGSSNKNNNYNVDILEVYIPIYGDITKPQTSEIIGAFEIYKDVSMLFNIMEKEFYKIPWLLFFSMGLLYLFLQIIIKKANAIISRQTEEIDRQNAELEEVQKQIKETIEEVIEHESFNVRFQGNNHVNCWEVKQCNQTGCPSYGDVASKCWLVAGTFCGGVVQGVFATKYGDCRRCEVYENAFKGRIAMIGESFNNMMTLLECKHNELQSANEKLNALVDIDPLTQIGNRRSFQNKIEAIHLMSLRYNHTYSIIICDIDKFKLYNDTYGHQQGDYALISASKTMKNRLRKTDEIFRWGGEEFVIILPQQNRLKAIQIAENLRVTIEAQRIEHKQSRDKRLTMSFGVASNFIDRVDYISWEAVLREADNQLYRAKSEGRNCVYPCIENAGSGAV